MRALLFLCRCGRAYDEHRYGLLPTIERYEAEAIAAGNRAWAERRQAREDAYAARPRIRWMLWEDARVCVFCGRVLVRMFRRHPNAMTLGGVRVLELQRWRLPDRGSAPLDGARDVSGAPLASVSDDSAGRNRPPNDSE